MLGNHDFESGQQEEIVKILTDAGVITLDGDTTEIHGIGFAGIKGFAGGFGRRALGPWGEDIIKKFVHEAVDEALKLESALARLRTDALIALLHYAPIQATVEGEPLEIYPFLGCSRLEEPLTRFPVTAVFHGHAHHGAPEGRTRNNVPVFNVSVSLMREVFPDRPFRLIELGQRRNRRIRTARRRSPRARRGSLMFRSRLSSVLVCVGLWPDGLWRRSKPGKRRNRSPRRRSRGCRPSTSRRCRRRSCSIARASRRARSTADGREHETALAAYHEGRRRRRRASGRRHHDLHDHRGGRRRAVRARIPEDMVEKSKLTSLGYKNLLEALGERFHASPTLLKRLNPTAKFAAGEEIKVPNVTDTVQPVGPPRGRQSDAGSPTNPAVTTVTVRKSTSDLTVTDGTGRTLIYAPVTTGSEHDPLPIGEWKVNGVQKNPTFRYNPELFWDADPTHSKAMIPAGPNNPVGLVWVDISRPHYGLHGTPEPATVGQT